MKPLAALASRPKLIAHAQTFNQSKTLSKRIIPESLVTRPAGQGERRLWERDWSRSRNQKRRAIRSSESQKQNTDSAYK